MDAVEFLRQVNKIENEIRRIRVKITHFEELSNDMKLGYEERVQNGKADKEPAFAKYVDMRIDAEKELVDKLEEYDTIYNEVEAVINEVGGNEAMVLYRIYISNEYICDIAIDMKYSSEGVRKIHERGLAKVDEILIKTANL